MPVLVLFGVLSQERGDQPCLYRLYQMNGAPPASTGSGCVGEAGDQMTGEHGGLVITQGTLRCNAQTGQPDVWMWQPDLYELDVLC